MVKIRNLALKDIPKINKLISFMDVEAKSFFDAIVLPYPLALLHKILPVSLKFLPEAYVVKDNKNILAYISLKKTEGNNKKWKISKLLMSENAYEAGRLLLLYITSTFGANMFYASIEETQGELIKVFVDGAGFRQCSRHQMWKFEGENPIPKNPQSSEYLLRPFKNSDSKKVSALYNESILPHFRPSLSKTPSEFHENSFAGLSGTNEFKYIIENKESNQLIAYFTIKTPDNKNYLLDVATNKGYETVFERILAYGYNLAKKRTGYPDFFVLNRNYLQTATHFEEILKAYNFEQKTNSVILVKDSFRTIKSETPVKEALLYSEINSNAVFKL